MISKREIQEVLDLLQTCKIRICSTHKKNEITRLHTGKTDTQYYIDMVLGLLPSHFKEGHLKNKNPRHKEELWIFKKYDVGTKLHFYIKFFIKETTKNAIVISCHIDEDRHPNICKKYREWMFGDGE